MGRLCEQFGGFLMAIKLYVTCKGKQSKGSYLSWRKETAFGKDGEFSLSNDQRRKAMRDWSVWALRSERKRKRRT